MATFRNMDRTAIAAIIIGFGATVAAMVMPLKYPRAPKWAIELSWWGGVFLIVAGGLYLVTEFTIGDLGGAVIMTCRWLSHHIIELLRHPASWIVLAFAGGIAAHRWVPSLWKKLPAIRKPDPRVLEWLSPIQAAERFVSAELFAKDRLAQEKAVQLKERVQTLEAELTGTADPTRSETLRELLAETAREREDADYVAKRRRTDVIECLRELLRSGKLVAKGREVKMRKGQIVTEREDYLSRRFWFIFMEDVDCLNLNSGVAQGGFPHQVFRDVMIGKNEVLSN